MAANVTVYGSDQHHNPGYFSNKPDFNTAHIISFMLQNKRIVTGEGLYSLTAFQLEGVLFLSKLEH